MSDYLEYYRKIALFEIYTIKREPKSRRKKGDYIIGVNYHHAYPSILEQKFPFKKINWEDVDFKSFSILKNEPPKRLIEIDGEIDFEKKSSIAVTDWENFFRSFSQVRNNLMHGSKMMLGMNLKDRDNNLMKASLEFIKFLDKYKIIEELY